MNRDRVVVSLWLGVGGGFILWVLHGVALVLGLPRLFFYSIAAVAGIYVFDYITEQVPREPLRWVGQLNEPR